MKKSTFTENKAEQTPTGGVLVGKRKGQTIIHNKGTLSGYLVGKTHAEGGIKAVNKSTGQPLEMQGGEVVITAPAVSDNTKREFEGKMMTNREILSTINEKGGGVAFAKDGMEIPKNVKRTGASYKYGGKTMTDHEIYKHITGGHLAEGMTLPQIAKMHKVSVKELQKQVDMGMKAESEHTSSKREQMQIVKDHLYENPKYYSLLKKAGLENGGGFEDIGLNLSKPIFENYWDGGFRMWIYDDPKAEEKLKSGEYDYFYPNFFEDYVEGIWHKTNLKKFKGAEHIVGYIEAKEDKTLKDLTTYGIEIGVMTTKPKYRRQGINSLMIKSIRDKYNLPQEAIDFYLPSEEGQLFIDSKKYNNGGRVHRGSLVRDAKKGNTPARDLNNYNDVLDLDADGMVGAETGLYAGGGKIDDWFEKPHNLRSAYNKHPFEVTVNDFDCAEKIKNKYKKVEIIKLVNPRVKVPITYVLVIKNWSSVEELKEMLIECVGNTVSYGFTSNEQIEVYKKMSFADGGDVKPYDANMEGDSADMMFAEGGGVGEGTKPEPKKERAKKTLTEIPDNISNFSGIIKDLPEKIKQLALQRQVDAGKTPNENLEVNEVPSEGGFRITETPEGDDFWLDILKGNFEPFKKIYGNYGEGTKPEPKKERAKRTTKTTASKTSKPIDLSYTKIWIDNSALFEKVQKKAFELGWRWQDGLSEQKVNDREMPIALFFQGTKKIEWDDTKYYFETNDFKEIFESDLFGEGTKPEPKKEKTIDLSNTKIWINNSALSEKVQKKAFELGWRWQDELSKQKQVNDREMPIALFFKDTKIIEWDDSRGYFKTNDYKEIFESDLFGEGTKPKTTASQTSKPIDLFNKKIWVYNNPDLSRRVQELGFANGYINIDGTEVLEINETSIFFGETSQENKFMFVAKNTKDEFIKEPETEIFESDLFPTASTPTDKTITDEDVELKKQILEFIKEGSWSLEKEIKLDKQGDSFYKEFYKISKPPTIYTLHAIKGIGLYPADEKTLKFLEKVGLYDDYEAPTKPIDLLNKKIWVNGNPDLSRRVQELAFANGFSTVDGKKIVNDTQLAGIFFGINKIMYIYDIPKGTFYLQEQVEVFESDLFPTETTTATTEIVEQPKPSKTEKPKRNFELERKYLTQRISDLAKELELKKPILSNEEVAFYQREINSFILKLRKLNDAEMSLKPIEERVRGVYDLKISSFENQYPETDMVSINGLKSQLTEKEYFNVRTPEFKSFFGDWETAYLTDNYAGVSKVINPVTKEPQTVFHGTNVLFVDWKTYDTNNAHYFAVKREMSEFFATTWEERSDKAGVDSEILKKLNPNRGSFLLRCFIDVKNPIDFSRFGVDKYPIREYLTFLRVNYNIGDFDFWTNITSHSGFTQDTEVYAWQIIRLWQSFTKYIKVFTMYDGYIFYEYIPTKAYGGLENASLSYCAFESNQIKFTDAYEFNALSNDSRFDLGGIL